VLDFRIPDGGTTAGRSSGECMDRIAHPLVETALRQPEAIRLGTANYLRLQGQLPQPN